MRQKLRLYEIDHNNPIAERRRSRRYIINDEAIKNLVQEFDLLQNPQEDVILHHLRALQYRLQRFEEWF